MMNEIKTKGVRNKALCFGTVLLICMVLACGTVAALEVNTALPADDVSVQINGQLLTFADAGPVKIDGRVMVPLRTILESMGAEVVYSDDKMINVRLNSTVVSLQIGSERLTIEQDGTKNTVEMDVKPFIVEETDRTYVPVRFIAEAFDWAVGWDHDAKTVIIISAASLLSGMDEDFSILMATSFSQLWNQDQAYKLNGMVDFMLLEELNHSITGTGSVEGIMKGKNLSFSLDADYRTKTENQPETNEKMKLSYIISEEGNVGYMSFPYMNRVYEIDDSAWIKISNDLSSMNDLSFIALDELPDMDSFTNYINFLLSLFADKLTVDSYTAFTGIYDSFKVLFGDEAFVQTGDTYTLAVNIADVFRQFIDEEDIVTLIFELTENMGSFTLTLQETSLKKFEIEEITVDIDFGIMDVFMNMTSDLPSRVVSMDFNMGMKDTFVSGSDVARLEGKFEIVPVEDVPVSAPPQGAEIYPITELFEPWDSYQYTWEEEIK